MPGGSRTTQHRKPARLHLSIAKQTDALQPEYRHDGQCGYRFSFNQQIASLIEAVAQEIL